MAAETKTVQTYDIDNNLIYPKVLVDSVYLNDSEESVYGGDALVESLKGKRINVGDIELDSSSISSTEGNNIVKISTGTSETDASLSIYISSKNDSGYGLLSINNSSVPEQRGICDLIAYFNDSSIINNGELDVSVAKGITITGGTAFKNNVSIGDDDNGAELHVVGYSYFEDIELSGTLEVSGGSTSLQGLTTNGNIIPSTADTYNLGTENKAWKNIHAGAIHLAYDDDGHTGAYGGMILFGDKWDENTRKTNCYIGEISDDDLTLYAKDSITINKLETSNDVHVYSKYWNDGEDKGKSYLKVGIQKSDASGKVDDSSIIFKTDASLSSDGVVTINTLLNSDTLEIKGDTSIDGSMKVSKDVSILGALKANTVNTKGDVSIYGKFIVNSNLCMGLTDTSVVYVKMNSLGYQDGTVKDLNLKAEYIHRSYLVMDSSNGTNIGKTFSNGETHTRIGIENYVYNNGSFPFKNRNNIIDAYAKSDKTYLDLYADNITIGNGNNNVKVKGDKVKIKGSTRNPDPSIRPTFYLNDSIVIGSTAEEDEVTNWGTDSTNYGYSQIQFNLWGAIKDSGDGDAEQKDMTLVMDGEYTIKDYPVVHIRANDTSLIEVHKTCKFDGSVSATDGFYDISDIRKKNIVSELSIDKCYDLVDKCQEIIYTLKDNPDKEHVGMIAQEVEAFFPEIVSEDAEGYKSLDYSKLTVVCLRLLKDIIDKLKLNPNK